MRNILFLAQIFSLCLIFIIVYIFINNYDNQAKANDLNKARFYAQPNQDPYFRYKTYIPPSLYLTLSDGAKIPVRIWSAPNEKAIILAYHGFNDSRDAWEDSANYFTERGYTIYSPDQRGFGEAPERGGWSSQQRMIQDVAEEVTLLHQQIPNKPIYLMGESMGGAVLLCLTTHYSLPEVRGYILLAPAVWGPKQLGILGSVSLQILNTVAPNWHLSGKVVPFKVVASDNQESLLRLYFDPLSLHKTQIKALAGLVDLMKQAVNAVPKVNVPMLVIYGSNDHLVPKAAMQFAWEKFPQQVRKDYIDNGFHLLLRDKNRQKVIDDIISWIESPDHWLPSGGDIAASTWMSVKGSEKVPFYLPSQIDNLVPYK